MMMKLCGLNDIMYRKVLCKLQAAIEIKDTLKIITIIFDFE